MIRLRSSSPSGPIWLPGGTMKARSTIVGRPFSSRKETGASLTPSPGVTRPAFSLGRGDDALSLQLRVGPQRVGGRFDRFLVLRREGAQRVLHAVAELAEHRL